MFRVSCLQSTAGKDVGVNLRGIHDLLEDALKRNPDLIVLPENFSFALSSEDFAAPRARARLIAHAKETQGYLLETLSEWAAEYGVWVVGGTLPVVGESGTLRSRCAVFDREGRKRAAYDKIHLFDADIGLAGGKQSRVRESKVFEGGNKPVFIRTEAGKLGLAVCYDLRFPELFRFYAQNDVVGVIVPSAFTATTGKIHWDVLTRARAVENGMYFFSANQWGEGLHGHSRAVDPKGRVIAERPAGDGVVFADLDPSRVKQARAEIPSVKHGRISVSWKKRG